MKHLTEDQEQQVQSSSRRPYHSPRLSVYGAVRELTNGGTGNQTEPNPGSGNQPPNKRP
jgi:hypothetical protein